MERLRPLDLPIYTGAPTGHGTLNHAWIHGGTATIKDDTLCWPVNRTLLAARRQA